MVSQEYVLDQIKKNPGITTAEMARSAPPSNLRYYAVRSSVYSKCNRLRKHGIIKGENDGMDMRWWVVE